MSSEHVSYFEKVRHLLLNSLDEDNYDLESLKVSINGDTDFLEDMQIGSLNLLEFFLKLEDEFNINIGEDQYSKLTTINKVLLYLTDLKAA